MFISQSVLNSLVFVSFQERHASFIEANLLNQLRVVWPGQVFPVWVERSKSICFFLRVGKH